ncbi:MAG: DUF3990 domain-containing protein [Muribaculaceae bacterium]|nr:DUF3990 domain-containing protein [Muribaculaceae bacterium]
MNRDVIEVYHAGVDIVKFPDVMRGRPELDFGQGFYVTDIYPQAVNWATKKAVKMKCTGIINKYVLHKADYLASANCNYKIFSAYDDEWLDFVIGNRMGQRLWEKYNYIEGGIADDRVTDTIDLYFGGYIDKAEAIRRLKLLVPNNQICLHSQGLLDKYLKFSGFIEI